MTLLLWALGILALGVLLPLVWHRTWPRAHLLGTGTAIGGAILGALASVDMLRSSSRVQYFFRDFPALGPWSIRLDAVAGVFLLVAFVVAGASAVFAYGYLRAPSRSRLALWLWPCFNLMVAAIVVALIANSVLLFLLAWETLTVASFLLVIMEHEKLESRKAAWLYLLASHASTAFLIAFFALHRGGQNLLSLPGAAPWWLLMLPLLGFGIKAGVVPLHVWLPEAHPAAPSHVSAVMSGSMVSVGIYGIFRILTSTQPSVALGTVVILAGAMTAVAGAIQAMSARRIKRLLAYSTVENSGIMLLGMGAALLAVQGGHREIAYLALTAVLAHVIAHGVFKSALFLGAGVVQHATGTGEIDELSGLARALPGTASVLLVASVTAVAAPPFAAFVSEFLLYLSAVRFLTVAPVQTAWVGVVLLVALALSGACAVAAFVKLYGVPFLGRARRETHGHGEWRGAHSAFAVLGGLCLLLGIVPMLLVTPAEQAVQQLMRFEPAAPVLHTPLRALAQVNLLLATVLAVSALLLGVVRSRVGVRRVNTWNCGFTQATPHAQYTGTSLVEPITLVFQPSEAPGQRHDPFMRRVYRPASYWIAVGASKVRRIQHGQVHWYLIYIFGALAMALLIEFVGRR